ncbi:MAG TPA: phosphoribosylformylglycinamidine synthase subunit PurS [Chloroflexia bacterium]|nr:phosphoribosylformylglycinamidine synthase subunit PurS [Chloroflexia bacterium]
MQRWLANIRITHKPVVNDPPGLAIRDALHNLGHDAVKVVRAGKYLQVYTSAEGEDKARTEIDTMCRRLLANPVIEDYTFDLQPVEHFPTAED